eukprot:6154680-Amphidinium_carterae.1
MELFGGRKRLLAVGTRRHPHHFWRNLLHSLDGLVGGDKNAHDIPALSGGTQGVDARTRAGIEVPYAHIVPRVYSKNKPQAKHAPVVGRSIVIQPADTSAHPRLIS